MIFREVEDRDLITKARRGAVEAYNLLVSRWEKRVFNYLLRLVRDREDALDLSQEVFLKAYQNLGKLDDVERFGPWLFRIAHNEAFSLLRKRKPEADVAPEEGGTFEPRPQRTFPIELSLAVEGALARLSARSAGDRGSEDLPGIQVRGNRRSSLLSGLHGEVAVVHSPRPPERHSGSNSNAGCSMSCSPNAIKDLCSANWTRPKPAG